MDTRHARPRTSMDDLVEVLREQLRLAQDREHRYEARERAYQEHIAQLTTMLDQAHQQNQRLLDMPRPAPPTRQSPASPPAVARPAARVEAPRGAMRRRIIDLLQDYPEGLTPAEMR